jgi:hypothetical protein
MRFGYRAVMFVVMVFIVAVGVVMLKRLMLMLVIVSFGEMQPKAQRHQQSGRYQPARQRLCQKKRT